MVDLHRHDEYSFFDGSGKAIELAKLAKEKGYLALGLTNHGNTSGLVQHYDACKSVGIKPILGVESYFLPKYKPQHRGYHLCLFAKNLEGYKNINIIQSKGELRKFYNPIIDFALLKKYHEGIICSSACVASYSSQCILRGEKEKAEKYLRKMVEIFGDDFYIEIQPYKVSEEGMQEIVNVELLKFARKLKIKCILTSDSHRGRKEDIDDYIKMHQLKRNDEEYLQHIKETYYERYMPDDMEMEKRFVKMHSCDFNKSTAIKMAKWMRKNAEELIMKVDGDIIDELAAMPSLPVFDETRNSFELLKEKVKEGLRIRKLNHNKQYIARAKEELKVIKSNKFEDYFLIVQDYTLWAKSQGIGVGPGRGSGCNCLINYLLRITDVDPIYFDLDYKRFIREDKKTLPDIDIDFETARRAEVQAYIVKKYKGKAVQIASYGMYKVDNLVNDLVKTYKNLKDDSDSIAMIKRLINKHQNQEKQIDTVGLMKDSEVIRLNKIYKGLFSGFSFMYNKVKYLGTHAAGVAVSKDSIYYYTAVRYDKKNNKYFSSYNLVDLERCGIIKYDLLGLSTLSSLIDLRRLTGNTGVTKDMITDKKILKAFGEGDCDGVFQYDKKAAQQILRDIHTDTFNDVVAGSAMNRPGPLSQGIPSLYAESKYTWTKQKDKPVYSKYIDSTFGCILYQEQVNAIAVEYGGLNWNQADKIRKMDDPSSLKSRELLNKYYDEFLEIFEKGMSRYGLNNEEAKELFDKFLNYAFNKGHAVGYALISLEEMFYKVYYPTEFWFSKLKYKKSDADYAKFCIQAVHSGSVIFLPHVNYSKSKTSIRNVEHDKCLQQGLSDIKDVGEKAAAVIVEERKKGVFTSFDNFYDRCKCRVVTSRVIDKLKEAGALEFNKKIYLKRVTNYNSALYSRGMEKQD